MSEHWRLALRYSAWLFGAAALVSGALFFVYGGGHAVFLLRRGRRRS